MLAVVVGKCRGIPRGSGCRFAVDGGHGSTSANFVGGGTFFNRIDRGHNAIVALTVRLWPRIKDGIALCNCFAAGC